MEVISKAVGTTIPMSNCAMWVPDHAAAVIEVLRLKSPPPLLEQMNRGGANDTVAHVEATFCTVLFC
jgi:hypothetical protein